MGAVVKFTVVCDRERERREVAPAVMAGTAAKIVIFPGVRYERSVDAQAGETSASSPPVVRDRLELID